MYAAVFEQAPLPAVLVAADPTGAEFAGDEAACDEEILRKGRVVAANAAARDLVGLDEPDGLPFADLAARLGGDVELRSTRLATGNGDGDGRVLVQFVDLSAERARERELAYRAEHDPLTGLLNRTGLESALDRMLAEPHPADRPGAVLFCDLNGFKQVNDRYGHLVGDSVVATVARRIGDTLRRSDAVGRFGGDEFIALLPGIGMDEAHAAAARVVHVVQEPIAVGEATTSVGICIGGVVLNGAVSSTEVLEQADAAMYRAKERGGDERYEVAEMTQSPQNPPPGTR